jgi:hypothetical protein
MSIRNKFPQILLIFSVLLFCFPRPAFSLTAGDFEITPRAGMSESYDDNITYVKDNPQSDWITELLVGLGIRREGKNNLLTMDVSATHQFFFDNSSFDNTSEYLDVNFLQEISKYDTLRITDTFSHSEEPRSFADAFGRTTGRYSTFQNDAGVDYRHDFSQQLAGNLRYANSLTNYSRNDLSDSDMNTVGTGLDYAFNSANIASLNYDWMKRDFSPGASATTRELAGVLRHFFTAQVYLDLQGGADFIKSFNEEESTKPLFRAALINDIDETTRTGIRFEKQYTTTSYTQDLFDMWRVSVNLLKQLTSRFTATFNAFYGQGTYVTTDIQDDLTGVGLGCNYDLTKDAKVNLGYSFSQDDSTDAVNSYTKNVIYLGMEMKF